MLVLSEEIRVHSLLTGYYFTHKAWALLAMGYFVVAKVIKLIQYLLGRDYQVWGASSTI